MPYLEWDPPAPRSVYGRSKLGGEAEVRSISGAAGTIVRTAWVSGAHGANMVKTARRLAASPGATLRFVADQHGCPTFTADLARAVVRLGLDRRPGTFHVTNQGETTWYDFVRAVLAASGHDAGAGGADHFVRPRPGALPGTPAGELPPRQCRTAAVRPAGDAAHGRTPWSDS